MAKAMSRLEEELRHLENEKATALHDLSSLRELCIKLDSGKDLMTQQLNSKSLELERVGAERDGRAHYVGEPFKHGFTLCSLLPQSLCQDLSVRREGGEACSPGRSPRLHA